MLRLLFHIFMTIITHGLWLIVLLVMFFVHKTRKNPYRRY